MFFVLLYVTPLLHLFLLLVVLCSGWASSSSAQGEDGKALYTQFDDNGVPTHDADGEPIVKNKARRTNALLWRNARIRPPPSYNIGCLCFRFS